MKQTLPSKKPSERVVIKLLLFAQLRDYVGEDNLVIELPSQATGESVRKWFSQRSKKAREMALISRLAVNGEYVSWEYPLTKGDEVAVIPPVSGG